MFDEHTQPIMDRIRADYEKALAQHDASLEERFVDLKKWFEDNVAAVVVKIFEEYGVCGRDGKPIKY